MTEYHTQGRSYSKAWGGGPRPPQNFKKLFCNMCGPPKILKNYFVICISIKKFKYLATKIEVGPPKCFS